MILNKGIYKHYTLLVVVIENLKPLQVSIYLKDMKNTVEQKLPLKHTTTNFKLIWRMKHNYFVIFFI